LKKSLEIGRLLVRKMTGKARTRRGRDRPAMRQMMKQFLLTAALAAGFAGAWATAASAGPIEGACMRSGRDAANRALCGCIQQVADMVLTGNDQRRAAKFFQNPDLAHKVWISQSAGDDAFWERYKSFGSMAEAYCAG
jgi:hypothetical protein